MRIAMFARCVCLVQVGYFFESYPHALAINLNAMSTFSRQRKARLRDFESRAAYDNDVRRYREWRYITVHPFADEMELIARLGLAPDDCKSADVWWHTGSDIVLLQTVAGGDPPFATTVRWCNDPPYLSIVAELSSPTTTLVELHASMDRIATIGLQKRFGDRRVRTLFKG